MFKLEISYQGIILIIALLVGLWLLTKLWPVVIMVVTATIFMTALLPYVEWLVKRGLPRTASVLLLLVGIVLFLAGLFALIVPAMIDEFQNLKDNLPANARDAEDFLDNFGIHVELQQKARDIDWNELLTGEAAFNFGQQVVFTILTIVTIAVLTAYLLIDIPRLSRFVYQFVPPGREPEFNSVLESLSRVVGGYIRGQVVTSAAITVFTMVLLFSAQVPNAIAFAVLAGFLDIIPLVGAILAVFLPSVAAFQESPEQALIVFIGLVAYQQFEDRFLVPRVYGQTLNLPPLVVFVAVLVGGQLFGIPGVLLALPAAAAARVGLDYFIERRGGLVAGPVAPKDEPLAPDYMKEDEVKEEEKVGR